MNSPNFVNRELEHCGRPRPLGVTTFCQMVRNSKLLNGLINEQGKYGIKEMYMNFN